MFLLRIVQYVLRFVFRILYCGINGSVIISCLYSLSLNLIDLRIPPDGIVSFLCLYLLNLTVLSGICLSKGVNVSPVVDSVIIPGQ